MPILLLADGLYPNNTVFDACQICGYRFSFTLKDDKLKRVWEEFDFSGNVSQLYQTKLCDRLNTDKPGGEPNG
jgi:hypothetical protein